MIPLEQAFTQHRSLLWTMSFRMLGNAADADEVVQDTFLRALRRPPATDRPLRPWLVRVAMNAARDRLRHRRRSPYVGPWLPSPVDENSPGERMTGGVEPSTDPELPAERLEQISYALLVALEQLTPTQRAVWLLREVMDMSTEEAAAILEVKTGTIKTTLHRARHALGPEAKLQSDFPTGMAAVGALATAIFAGDVEQVTQLLTHDVVALTDGGGVYRAARRAIVGSDRVARLLVGLSKKVKGATYDPTWIGGCPAMITTMPAKPGFAPVVVTLFGIDANCISRVWTISAPDKLASRAAPKTASLLIGFS